MASIIEIITKLTNIEQYIDDALDNEVADVAKLALLRSASKNVYGYQASPSAMELRRYGNGGIGDMGEYNASVSNNTIVVTDDAQWSGHGRNSGMDRSGILLREAIAQGLWQGNAGARPFHEEAEKEIVSDGEAMEALRRGLARQGIMLD